MRVRLIGVGRVRAGPLRAAAEEYAARLRPYAHVVWEQVDAEPVPERLVPAEVERVLAREAERVQRALQRDEFVIALDRRGEELSSEELAAFLRDLLARGRGRTAWLIGGPLGLHPCLLERAGFRLSLSRLTFPHELVPVIVLEQVYRAFRIMRGEPYHY